MNVACVILHRFLLEPCQISLMELCASGVSGSKLWFIFAKSSIVDVFRDPKTSMLYLVLSTLRLQIVNSCRVFHSFMTGLYPLETSPLICCANQWAAFYMITTSVMKSWLLFFYSFRTDILKITFTFIYVP